MPSLFRQPGRYRREPNAERQGKGQGLFEQTAKAAGGRGRAHFPCSPPATAAAAAEPNRARPFRSTARPLTAPSSDSTIDRKSTRLNSSHLVISYAVFCLKKKRIPVA